MNIRLSDAEKVFIIHGAHEGIRCDGRGVNDYRPIILERDVMGTTDGSARVRIADTDLLVGIKLELATVDDTSKVQNRIRFSLDCSANATPQFEGKGGDAFAEETAAALYAAYDNDHVIPDINKLTVSPNHHWIVYVDIVVLKCGGSIIDAASIAAKAALSCLHIPLLVTRPAENERVQVELPEGGHTWQLDTTKAPLLISVYLLGSSHVVDAAASEEACARAVLCVGVSPPAPNTNVSDDDMLITLLRVSGSGSLERASVEEMTDCATRAARTLEAALVKRFATEKRVDAGVSFLE